MLMKNDKLGPDGLTQKGAVYASLYIGVALLACFAVFSESLLELEHRWSAQEEYSHGFLIPLIVAWLLWTRRDAIVASIGRPSWTGPVLILVAAAMHIVGKLSALFMLSQLGFIVAVIGVILGFGGYSLLKVTFVPIIFLIFAIPLPYFIDAMLSFRLQLISSELGVFFIRLFQIPVYLEGNVIDLGVYKLQVVEACSGLRYLYPLMSLGFLAAYLFQAPLWQRAVVFLSTIPITILMNSLRIGIVGILVNSFGPQDADGFLHMFEGWIIFIACAGVLVAEMSLLAWSGTGNSFFDVFHAPRVTASTPKDRRGSFGRAPIVTCFVMLCAVGLATYFVSSRAEINPERNLFAVFPTTIGDWHGHPSSMDTQTATFLGLTDYILSDYVKKDGRSVNLYVAYYASQRSGLSPHSPAVCIPGNGWQIIDLQRINYSSADATVSLPLNRVIISRSGAEKQLVYYWFDERGMKIANEWTSKLYLLRDAMFKNRTDGALVRLTTPVYPGEDEAEAEKRLKDFTRTVVPSLDGFLPAAPGLKIKPAMTSVTTNHS